VVVTFFDISNLKKIEEQLRSAKEGAEVAAKVKAEFLGNMSHEIRTPVKLLFFNFLIFQDEWNLRICRAPIDF
jgi:hypothetical protein